MDPVNQNPSPQPQAPEQAPQQQPPVQPAQPAQQTYQQPPQQPYPPQQVPYQVPPSGDNNSAKVICILDYFSVLCLLGLFVEKDNPDVRFHTNQGLILFLLEVAIGVISTILRWIPVLGFIIRIICSLLSLVCVALAIVGIVNVAQNQRRPLPVIGNLFTFIK